MVEVLEIEPFYYWPEGHDAVVIMTEYCADQWREGFNGISSLDLAAVMPVIQLFRKKRTAQLILLEEVKAFAAGVLKYINEQRKQSAK